MTTTAPPRSTLRLLTGAIGAVIDGVDLSLPLSDGDIDMIRTAVTDHQVVFLRDQHLDAEQLGALAGRFGALTTHPVDRIVGSARTVATITDTADRPPAAFDWHTDLSWTARPPSWGFLHAVDVPDVGGDTLWASSFAMYDLLHPQLQQLCEGLAAIHRPSPALVNSVRRRRGDDVALRLLDEYPGAVHPLIRRHPVSGRPALYLSKLYTDRLVGDTGIDADLLLDRLNRGLDDPHVQVRWRWRRGDVAIWDEASTCHRALGDHFPRNRTMQRCTIEGPAPRAPSGWTAQPDPMMRALSAPIAHRARSTATPRTAARYAIPLGESLYPVPRLMVRPRFLSLRTSILNCTGSRPRSLARSGALVAGRSSMIRRVSIVHGPVDELRSRRSSLAAIPATSSSSS
ncbi:MAG: TauD/TfdA dioxygenase family protein [Acidimicrobiales bacterium]